jgi:hypothetical protein
MRRTMPLLVAMFIMVGSGMLLAQAVAEYKMKALYLYNFALLTDWPDASGDDGIRICLFGRDRIGGELEAVIRSAKASRRMRILYPPSLDAAKGCHILYLDGALATEAAGTQLRAQLAALADAPILTVTDSLELFQQGSVVGMFLEGNRLVFDVNLDLAARNKLTLSAKMLRVARKTL